LISIALPSISGCNKKTKEDLTYQSLVFPAPAVRFVSKDFQGRFGRYALGPFMAANIDHVKDVLTHVFRAAKTIRIFRSPATP
jgi:hypothetical protein